MMSFWVVPASCGGDLLAARVSGFCSSATTWYIASSHIAVALIVIEVFIPVSGMSSKRRRISPRCGTGTPTLPTSPRDERASPGRSRSGSAGRRRPTGRSAPWRGWCGRARSTRRRSSGRRTCASPRDDPSAGGPSRSWAERRTRSTGGNRSRGVGCPTRRGRPLRRRRPAARPRRPGSAGRGAASGAPTGPQPRSVRWWPVAAGRAGGDGEHLERGHVDGGRPR